MWQKRVFKGPGQGNIHKINTPVQQQEMSRAFLNSINKITHQMCTFKTGMLEHSVMGPQIPLGKQSMCMLLHDMSCMQSGQLRPKSEGTMILQIISNCLPDNIV